MSVDESFTLEEEVVGLSVERVRIPSSAKLSLYRFNEMYEICLGSLSVARMSCGEEKARSEYGRIKRIIDSGYYTLCLDEKLSNIKVVSHLL